MVLSLNYFSLNYFSVIFCPYFLRISREDTKVVFGGNFAWFTTRNEATLATGSLKVDTLSSIKITVEDVGKFAATVEDTPSNSVTDSRAGRSLGLVSSPDGVNFYAPTALTDAGAYSAGDMAAVTSAWTGQSYVGYLKYFITVTADAETNAHDLKLYFDVTSDAKTGSYYRIGLNEVKSDKSLADAPQTKIFANAVSTYNALTPSGTPSVTTVATPKTANAAVTLAHPFTNASTTATKYFMVSLWIEGNVDGATNAISGGQVSATAHFLLA